MRWLPKVRFVIDHLAKPQIVAGPRDAGWERAMAPFADCENVSIKLSGMVTEAGWADWTPDDLWPYVQHAVEFHACRWVQIERDVVGEPHGLDARKPWIL